MPAQLLQSGFSNVVQDLPHDKVKQEQIRHGQAKVVNEVVIVLTPAEDVQDRDVAVGSRQE